MRKGVYIKHCQGQNYINQIYTNVVYTFILKANWSELVQNNSIYPTKSTLSNWSRVLHVRVNKK